MATRNHKPRYRLTPPLLRWSLLPRSAGAVVVEVAAAVEVVEEVEVVLVAGAVPAAEVAWSEEEEVPEAEVVQAVEAVVEVGEVVVGGEAEEAAVVAVVRDRIPLVPPSTVLCQNSAHS